MRVIESCAKCLYEKQEKMVNHQEYLSEIKQIIENRDADDTAPYLVYLFNGVYERYFGKKQPYTEIKKQYNNLVLSMGNSLRTKIEESEDPLVTAFMYARIGNYIDFGAMNQVDEKTFLGLFEKAELQQRDIPVLKSFVARCERAGEFLLLADNCGEIVLDKLFLEQMRKRFPHLHITVMVRGKEVLNDATMEDARYVGIDRVAEVISNGNAVAGTVYHMLPQEAKKRMDKADVILSKGQGNYETLCNQGFHIFYSFLCKCDLFTSRFEVPRLTGIFVEEK